MKKILIPLAGALIIACLPDLAGGQILLEENFEYTAGTALTSNGWTAHSGGGTNPITVSSGSLSYPDYLSSGIGNAAWLDGEGEDVHRDFTSQTSGTLYLAFLVNLTNATAGASGDYFFHLNSTTQAGKVYVKKDNVSGNFALGLAKGAEDPSFTGFDYSFGTTYLVVLKYTVVSGSSNDFVSLFVFSSDIPSVEPSSATLGPLTPGNSDPTSLNSVALRQGASTVLLTIDGIRVGLGWTDTPLPIQFASFTASVVRGSDVEVQWRTVSETNNFGFEIHRKRGDVAAWTCIGFVEGHGTTLAPQSYSYLDRSVPFGKYRYRVRQIDLDGKTETFPEMEVNVGLEPGKFVLAQNYPNPFNPSTTIEFVVPQAGWVSLKVYNMLGQEVATLYDGNVEASKVHTAEFNAGGLASGLYSYQLRGGGAVLTRRMMVLR